MISTDNPANFVGTDGLSCWLALVVGAMWDEQADRPDIVGGTCAEGEAVSTYLAACIGGLDAQCLSGQLGMACERIVGEIAYVKARRRDRAYACRLRSFEDLYSALLKDGPPIQ